MPTVQYPSPTIRAVRIIALWIADRSATVEASIAAKIAADAARSGLVKQYLW
jgi:hypothetical protein